MANSTNESVSYIVFQVPLSHAFLLEDQCQIRGILGIIVYNFLRLGGVVIRYHLPDE